MKKFILGLVSLLALTTSCSKHEIEYYDPSQVITENYNKAFIKYVGGPIASNQDWGFGSVPSTRGAMTRSNGVGEVIKPDNGKDGIFEFTNEEKNANNWRSPEGVSKYVSPITDAEREWVQAWFDNPDNAGLSEEGKEFNSFYVQQVHNKLYSNAQDNKNGYFWEKKNGVEEKTNKTYKVKMDQLRIGSARDEANTVHINDFNATDKGGNAWNAIYVKDGSSKQFAYWASYGNQWQWKFRCVELTVPGTCFSDGQPRTGYYVGLSYYCDKVEVEGQKGERIGEDEINICNDWILKITPGETTPPTRNYTLRVLGEDLTFGEDSDADFDFNDVVFDVAIDTEKRETWIKLQAAGGTLPLYIDGKEVHQLFGVNTTDMVNTGRMSRDAVEVKLDNYYSNAKNIPVTVTKNGVSVPLKAERGEPASKIAVNNMNFQWCAERISMKEQYPLFTEWCKSNSFNSVWWEQ